MDWEHTLIIQFHANIWALFISVFPCEFWCLCDFSTMNIHEIVLKNLIAHTCSDRGWYDLQGSRQFSAEMHFFIGGGCGNSEPIRSRPIYWVLENVYLPTCSIFLFFLPFGFIWCWYVIFIECTPVSRLERQTTNFFKNKTWPGPGFSGCGGQYRTRRGAGSGYEEGGARAAQERARRVRGPPGLEAILGDLLLCAVTAVPSLSISIPISLRSLLSLFVWVFAGRGWGEGRKKGTKEKYEVARMGLWIW